MTGRIDGRLRCTGNRDTSSDEDFQIVQVIASWPSNNAMLNWVSRYVENIPLTPMLRLSECIEAKVVEEVEIFIV